jgi:signal transduction histidine kinase/CheY-like chemotaxis protein
MIADPESLRAEPFVQVGALLKRDVGLIVDRWCRRAAQEQPSAARVHHDTLRDHLPELLNVLGHSLASSGNGSARRHGEAADHGGQRWQAGWSLAEVVRDYQILRLVVIEYLDENLGRPLTIRENLALNLVLDEAISDSVEQYARHREEEARSRQEEEAQRLRRHAAELADADRHKDEFLAVLGHELRNPLAPLRNALHLLRQRGDAATVTWAGDLMDRQVRHLTRLVDDLLDVSRIARGKLGLRRQRLDLTRMVRTAVEDRRALLEGAGRVVALALPAGPVWVHGDADRLAQVLDNLLVNAHKFTDRGGRVSVSVATDPASGRATVAVRDDGVGIDPALLPRLFRRYLQSEVDPERAQGGLGLGLALVKGLVELHGGSVAAHSAGLGQGSVFTVTLPAEAAPPPAEPVDTPPRTRVLVIEDNRDGADSLAVLLRLFGFEVRVAYAGAEGVAQARAEAPDVALCDLGLPGMDGYAVARALQADPATAGVRLVAVSGHGTEAELRRCAEAGFLRHVLKPVEPEDLRKLLIELVGPDGAA